MKQLFNLIFLFGVISVFGVSCSDDDDNNPGGGGSTGIVLSTTAITNISSSGATSGGNITSDGGSAIVDRGVCWSTSSSPTIADDHTNDGNSVGVFVSALNGLSAGTTYYVRAYATNANSTAYGNQVSFTTSGGGSGTGGCTGGPSTVTDVDGNVYNVVTIGNQCWMKENLKTTKYRNGSPIPGNLSDAAWGSTTGGAQADYDNDPTNKATYGKLYNFYAVADPRGLCPTGWHVPSDAEWQTLETALGMPAAELNNTGGRGSAQNVGGKMKSVSPLWLSPNAGATNSSGFSGLPGGYRDFKGTYDFIGGGGCWWSSTQYSTANAWVRFLNCNYGNVDRNFNFERVGFSVRCVRD